MDINKIVEGYNTAIKHVSTHIVIANFFFGWAFRAPSTWVRIDGDGTDIPVNSDRLPFYNEEIRKDAIAFLESALGFTIDTFGIGGGEVEVVVSDGGPHALFSAGVFSSQEEGEIAALYMCAKLLKNRILTAANEK